MIINEQTEGYFTECSGLGLKVDTISHRIVRDVIRPRAPVTPSEVVLRDGLTDSRAMIDWLMGTVQGKVERRNISIVLMDPDPSNVRKPVMRWNLARAWPSDWRGIPVEA